MNSTVAEQEVVSEDYVTSGSAERKINGWWTTARISGLVKIGDKFYTFDKTVSIRLTESPDED